MKGDHGRTNQLLLILHHSSHAPQLTTICVHVCVLGLVYVCVCVGVRVCTCASVHMCEVLELLFYPFSLVSILCRRSDWSAKQVSG